MRAIVRIVPLVCALVLSVGGVAAQQSTASTPPQLVAAYDSLADTILGAKQTEWNLVHSILATTYSHAEATVAAAKAKLSAGKDAKADIEKLANLVAQLGNEGDAAVAAVRKRLIEGGHHHQAAGEQKGIYDEGFVIVTRQAKKGFLDAANRIGKIATKPDAGALDTAWKDVKRQFEELHKNVGGM